MKNSKPVASIGKAHPGSAPAKGISVTAAPGKKPAAAATAGIGSGLSVVKSKPKEKIPSPLETRDGMAEFLCEDEGGRIAAIEALLKITEGPGLENAISDLTAIIDELGPTSTDGFRIIATMTGNFAFGSAAALERGVLLLQSLIHKVGRVVEPFAITLIPKLFVLHADRSQVVRDTAAAIIKELANLLCPHAFRTIFPMLTEGMRNEDWRVKVGSLELLRLVSSRMSRQLSPLLPAIIPQTSECVLDSKKQVQTAGLEALEAACRFISNEDIRPRVPQLVSVIARPDETPKALDGLLETTFVATVDAPTLALIAPLLVKALRGRVSTVKRKASKIIENMCKLVKDPSDVAPFVPMLLPALDKVIDEIADEEVCSVAKVARETLLKAMGQSGLTDADAAVAAAASAMPSSNNLNVNVVTRNLANALQEVIPSDGGQFSPATVVVIDYVASMAAHLAIFDTPTNPTLALADSSLADPPAEDQLWRYAVAMSNQGEWRDCVTPYASGLSSTEIQRQRARSLSEAAVEAVEGLSVEDVAGDGPGSPAPYTENHESTHVEELDGEKIAASFRKAALGIVPDAQVEVDVDDASLCDIEFSLAFGGKILLHGTRLRLGKGRRYGIMGKNGAGKTTLLTNIGSGNIEGLPPHLKTIYVQHDDNTDDFGVPLVDEITNGEDMVKAGVQREEVENALKAINFTTEMLEAPRSALSGGWKMKVLIIRAMLARADILLLDEPTNHLDAASVAWLTNYLNSQKEVTCMIVSHDTAFLDNVITDVIHYEHRQLVYYHGNLTHFVAIHPEAKYYYELESSTLKFVFPMPERLDGINSTTRAVMKMDNITYTYPGAGKPTLVDASVKLCLGSRVAVVGANGAGKSTLIKLLVQEIEADEGSGDVWKHHNLRIAYVAQHSLHHVEQHLDSSPVDYIKWRFAGGVDKESLSKTTTKLTDEEEAEEKTRVKKYGEVDKIHGRRKNGRTMEYECTFIGQTERDENKYITLEAMLEMGLKKQVEQCDAKIAAANAGLDLRPLLNAEIQRHLDDFSLEAEFGTHGLIRRMSGGQKVKLVLAAAMWNKPHLLVLDEPTNYLDREALGALTQAIKGFGGGVIIISHNKEFTDALCTEHWLVKDGIVHTTGDVAETELKAAASANNKIRKSKSNNTILDDGEEVLGGGAGCTNKTIKTGELPLNPRTLEVLSKKQVRLLSRVAEAAGMSIKDYVLKINCFSPEWKWLA